MSDSKSPRRRVVAVLLAGALLSTGCVGLPNGGVSDAESVGDAVHQRYESIDRYSATVTKTVETSTGTSHVRATIMVDTGEEMRIAYQTGPRAGTVERLDISSTSATKPLLSTGLKQVSGGSTSYGALAAELVRTSNVSRDRMTTLNGRRTAIVSLVPQDTNNRSERVKRRIWIDTERLIPQRIQTRMTTVSGETITETVHYSNVTIHESSRSSSQVESSRRVAIASGGAV